LLTDHHPRYEHFKKQSFSPDIWRTILNKAKTFGVEVYADVFGLEALNLAIECGIDGFKVHSSDMSNKKLLQKLKDQKKKIFLSTGGTTIQEIKYALENISASDRQNEIILLHGFQAYPTSVRDAGLSRLGKLKELFGDTVKIGYSDHTSADDRFSTMLPLIVIPYGVEYIEKHVTLNRSSKGVDYHSSFEPRDLEVFIKEFRCAESAITANPFKFSDAEKNYRDTVKKQWVTKRALRVGDVISDDNIEMKRSPVSINTPLYEDIIGKKVTRPIEAEESISRYKLEHKVLAVIVARSGSSRLPDKATMDINGKPAICHLLERVSLALKKGYIDTVAFCTTKEEKDNKLVNIASGFPFKIYRGSVNNVLSRMMLAVSDNGDHDIVLRITGDDLLVDPDYIKEIVECHLQQNANYTDAKGMPSGTETEAFDTGVLRFVHGFSKNSSGTEYLTNYIKENADQFCTASLVIPERHAKGYRLTLDTIEDYEVIKRLLAYLESIGKDVDYTLDDIGTFFENNPEVLKINKLVQQKKTPVSVDTEIDWPHYTRIPLVSVYITSHNYGKFLKKAIESVLKQKFMDFELIIIDDGSTDNSVKIMESYQNHPKIKIICQKNKGLNVTCNIALKLSRGKYIMRLDADDYLDENALLVMTEALERDSEAALVFPDYYMVDEKGEIISQERRHDSAEVNLFDRPAHGACTMIRKETLLKVGGYSEDFACQDGYDIWLKVIKKSKIINTNIPLFYYRRHGRNSTNDEHRILETRHHIVRKNLDELKISKKNHISIIPIRGGEENPFAVRNFAGTTLLDITVNNIFKNENVSKIIVSSPDSIIIDYAKKYAAKGIMVDKRPEGLGNYNTLISKTIDYLLEKYSASIGQPDTVSVINFEYPFRKHFFLDNIINNLYLFEADSVLSVIRKDANYYYHNGKGLVSFNTNRTLRLERDFTYEAAGGLHSVRYSSYAKHGNIVCGKIGHVIIDEESSMPITSDSEFEAAESFYKAKLT
ncbi:MAG: N-acetylneuraminate synthase family protein, partial [Candidatus Omnitrophica bacterium]|nr:N-acetylneuraminate synthase family protein [Candidatus Omnitrophota bacterium]